MGSGFCERSKSEYGSTTRESLVSTEGDDVFNFMGEGVLLILEVKSEPGYLSQYSGNSKTCPDQIGI
jgi:hypothetical protein